MRAWGLLALLFLVGPSAWAVPGTNWDLVDPDRWRDAETARIAAIAATLPEALRQIPGGLQFERVERDQALDSQHPLVRSVLNGTRLQIRPTTFTSDSDAKALVHGLMHVLDARHQWSQTDEWTMLSDWGSAFLGGPIEQDVLTYAGGQGMVSAAEDLATSGVGFLVPGAHQRPGCGLRSKWRFLQNRLGRPPADPCTPLAKVDLDPEKIVRLELLYAQPSTRNPGSLAGHLSLGLQYKSEPGQTARHDIYQLGAGIGSTKPGSFSYVVKGLGGGFPSVISRQPFAKVAMSYSKQNRSLTRLELKLNSEQKVRLLERLDDVRQGWDRSYLFLTRNCTYLPQTLIEWALAESLELPLVAGPDVLLGILERRDLIEPLPASSSFEFTQLRRAQEARRLMADASAELLTISPTQRASLAPVLARVRHSREGQRVLGIQGLAALSPQLLESDPRLLVPMTQLLVWAEETERLTQLRSRGKRGNSGLAALWKAQAGIQGQAQALGVAPVGTAGAEQMLLRALLARQTDGDGRPSGRTLVAKSSHTALRRMDVLGGARWMDSGGAPSLHMRSTWYRYRLGEARRYSFGEGVDLTGMDVRWRMALTETRDHSVDLLPIRLIWFTGHRRALNPGVYLSLLRTRSHRGTTRTVHVDGFDFGAPLELWQHDRHRLHVGVSAGISGGMRGVGDALLEMDWSPEVALPVRTFMRAGSAREPLTGLALSTVWKPTILGDLEISELGLELDASQRLGAVWGADIALVGVYRLEPAADGVLPDWDGAIHWASIGLAVERY